MLRVGQDREGPYASLEVRYKGSFTLIVGAPVFFVRYNTQRKGRSDEGENMRRRFGRRRTFGRSVVVLGLGALTVIAVVMRRRATADASREFYSPAGERFGEVRASSQESTQRAQQTGREEPDEILAQHTEKTGGSTREEIRRVEEPIRLRSLSGQPLMRVIRASAPRSRGGA